MKIRRFLYGGLVLAGLAGLVWWLTSILMVGPTPVVFSWGFNLFGQVGDGTNKDRTSPVIFALPGGVSVTSLSGGSWHSLAIGSDGKLYGWGNNDYGQLGDGTTTKHDSPVAITLPAGVSPTSLSAGDYHNLAIGSDGKLYSWGDNVHGQLGDGTFTDQHSPVLVKLPAGVKATAIATGDAHSMALGSDGNLYTWGDNQYGEIGNGTYKTTNPNIPTMINLPAGIKATVIAASGYHNMALGNDGNIYAWGDNLDGEIGNGVNDGIQTSPVRVNLPVGVKATAIAAGGDHNLAIGSDGNLYSWGANQGGQWINRASPSIVNLPPGVNAKTIAAGGCHSLVIGNDGNLYAWGCNITGELGDGTKVDHFSPNPELIKLPGGSVPLTITAGPGQNFVIARPSAEFLSNNKSISQTAGQ